MGSSGSPSRGAIWRTAFITGLITSTFSTLVILLGSGRIGTGVRFRFMEIGTVGLRDVAVDFVPRWYAVVARVVIHQSADIFWAVVSSNCSRAGHCASVQRSCSPPCRSGPR
ncbi:MAG: hypothetical protein M3Q29_07610 [Chloroflexota bacterium]|nr:hypothetical protein [Chloroflexota bacterium]